jgi:hypothetical protein
VRHRRDPGDHRPAMKKRPKPKQTPWEAFKLKHGMMEKRRAQAPAPKTKS